MSCRMVAISGPGRGLEVALSRDENSLGRDPANTIQLERRSVSRNHASIRRNGDVWMIRDLESRNGTYVNRMPVRERTLQPGDEVQIGDCVFLFLAQPVSEVEAAPEQTELAAEQLTRTMMLPPEHSTYLVPGKLAEDLSSAQSSRVARDLDTLLSFSFAVHELGSPEEIAGRILECLMNVTPASRAVVWLRCEDSEGARFGYTRGAGATAASLEILNVITTVASERAAVITELSATIERYVATAPILVFGQIHGVVALASSCALEERLQLLSAIAAIAGPAIHHALEIQRLHDENSQLRRLTAIEHGIVGESQLVKNLLQMIARVAPAQTTVLILGESGAGKELVARAIHANSPRAGKPFIAINCATLSEALLESELFGHERGAFTGATAAKKGKLEMAQGGTLFLDEIGEMAPLLQAKLLRVLQEREFERVGGLRPIRADIRLLTATNRDIEKAVEDGTFRRDLYFRLNVISLRIPPLRERREDIILLANYFIARYAEQTGRKVRGLSSAARAYLLHHDWPGNVRELENVIERAVVLGTTDTVLAEDLPEALLEKAPPGVSGANYYDALTRTKKELIVSAIDQAGGSHIAAAKALGLHPNYLSRLIRTLDLKDAVR